MLKRTLPAALLLAAATAASGCVTSRAVMDAEVARTNTQTVLAFEETVFNKHEVQEGFDRYVGATYTQHNPLVPDGKEGAVKALSYVLTNEFPRSRVIVKRTLAQRNLVAVHVFWDQKPGETRGLAIIDIYRLENGKIVEHWDVGQQVPDKAANDNSMF
jgi:predicted SnoaL-like aldol condensation-catalyzing enzyme